MKQTTIILALFATLSFCSVHGQSMGQEYTTALGLKVTPTAVTIKHFLNDDRAVEGLLYFWNYGFRFTGLYEFHWDINAIPGLKWYVGPGAHVGFWSNRFRDNYPGYDNNAYVGFDGVLGLDYKIDNAPVNVSLDWQPSFNLGNGPGAYYGFYSGFGGIAVRYAF
ncbi:MAG TPA: hypothetical protein VM012_10210 [Flavitalea sp.]|nr:hypothetical protein [Flavitalea sp.]